MMRTLADRAGCREQNLDNVAWGFLRSKFTGPTYVNWSMEKRIDAYLQHYGPAEIIDDGDTYHALVERIMANVGPAVRSGLLKWHHIGGSL